MILNKQQVMRIEEIARGITEEVIPVARDQYLDLVDTTRAAVALSEALLAGNPRVAVVEYEGIIKTLGLNLNV